MPQERNFRYEALPHWGDLPKGWKFQEVVGVATDSKGRAFVFDRGPHPVLIFERDGRFVGSWGDGLITRSHGIHIGPDDTVWLTDDSGHNVRKFTPEGRLLLTLGTPGKPSDTGIDGLDYRTIKRVGAPFHRPTNVALAADGSLYVTDGYGNARVHKFTPDGRLLFSFGEPGDGPGQFNLPHGIALDAKQRIYVADRENSRIQVFTAAGQFLTQWTDVARPMEVFIDPEGLVFVAEVGFDAGMFPWNPPRPGAPGARLSIFDQAGRLLARWGGAPGTVGGLFAPHDIWADDRGDLYVSEVVTSAGTYSGGSPPTHPTLQKFIRRS
jgi:DNA-binding beta-propeller fold protein YncE